MPCEWSYDSHACGVHASGYDSRSADRGSRSPLSKTSISDSISRLQQGQHLVGSLFQPSNGARLLRKAHEGLARPEPSMSFERAGMAYLWGEGAVVSIFMR
jgi:hypothetical protein